MKYIVLGPLLRLIYRPKVEGAEHLPAEGAAILASNHLSFSDSIFIPLVTSRRVTFIAKQEYFTGKGIKGWFMRQFFTAAGCIPVDRTGGRAAQAAIDTGMRVLREGHVFGIYPEGTRSPDGRLYRGKTGVARMSLETGAPVIPIAMINTDDIQPVGHRMWRVRQVRMRVGPPLDFSRYQGMAGERFIERAITDEIMYELMQLSGREYVDRYASRGAAPAPQTPVTAAAA